MSRAPPFPTRRRSPPPSNDNIYAPQPSSAPGSSGTATTRPLNISRQADRTPMSASPYAPPNTAPLGPSRPQRSDLRARQDGTGSERTSIASRDRYRDSASTSRSDMASSYRNAPYANSPSNGQGMRSIASPVSPQDDQETPTSLTSALSAFQTAGTRRRQTVEDPDYLDYQREREQEIEAERLRQQKIREKAPGMRSRAGTRGEIDAVLDQVRDGWEFVIDPDFNHVDLALQLLDQSSTGKDIESFTRTKHKLAKALKGSVDKHYQAFASSLPHHASILSHLTTTQTEITSARTALTEAKEALGGKRADLVQLWNRGQMLDEMIKILDQIEHLKDVPDLLETLMSEKRLLQASILLVKSLKTINKPDMLEIGAIADLRSYLNGQETALREILVDELQSHLYLKSFWCETRWAAYVPNQHSLPKVDFEVDGETQPVDPLASPVSPSSRPTRLTRFLDGLDLRPNEPPYDLNDNTKTGITVQPLHASSDGANPEADSFSYIETLLEALAVLGKLGAGLDTIAQRLPAEIFQLVETTLDEVEERVEFGKKENSTNLETQMSSSRGVYIFSLDDHNSIVPSITSKAPKVKASCLRLSALESFSMRIDHEILRDLFWTLYSKLDAVAQGLRVVTEVANRIGTRRDYKDSSGAKPGSLFPLPEIWTNVQTEVRTLIQDYLVDEQQGSTSARNPITSINEVLRDGKFNKERVKPVFRFSDTDPKTTTKALREHEEGLAQVLKNTMPGLASSAAVDTAQTIVASNNTDDSHAGADQHHRLLIRPDAFHVTVLFHPTLTFLHKVADILPPGVGSIQASSSVLDEFVLKVYLPQLEEKVSDLFHDAVSGPEAFQADPLSLQISPQPLAKASTHLLALVNSLCAMLRTSPFHRENYSRLILSVVIQFYQRCSDRFQTLTTSTPEAGGAAIVALAAQWAQRAELQTCLQELIGAEKLGPMKRNEVFKRETSIELSWLEKQPISKADLIQSGRNLAGLASLYKSVSWFAAELTALKPRADDGTPLSPTNLEPLTALSPATPFIPEPPTNPFSEELSLSLSREMALRFQALLRTYDQLSNLILDAIRLDIRCRIIHYLDASMKHGTYDPSYEVAEPDPYVVDLNNELMRCDESLSPNLPLQQRNYLFAGIGCLINEVLIRGASSLRLPTQFGIQKILRNISALQQSVKSLVDRGTESELERARRYYSLFFVSPQEMLDGIRKQPTFTFDEYQNMLNLQCGVDPSLKGNEGASKAIDRNYSLYVIDLHALDLDKPESAT